MLLFTLKFGCEMQGRKIIQPDKIVNSHITIKLKISNLNTVKSQTQNLKSQNFKNPKLQNFKIPIPRSDECLEERCVVSHVTPP